jgi:formylglycine-generating enzyme required for sulfatase activity
MNVLGFYDLGGNAREWMWDGLDEKTGHRVFRGGYWGNSAEGCTVAGRGRNNPVLRFNEVGFRVALSSVP